VSRLAAVLIVLGFAALAALPASCFVHRASDDYGCGSDGDCKDGRVCDTTGFCVIASSASCPSPCTSCDVVDKTCRIECNSGKPCGNVQCPPGYDCTIRCTNSGACGSIDCAQGRSCDIACLGSASCGNLNCGPSSCSVRCSGVAACPSVDCAASCSCDVDCNQSNECPSMSCPIGAGPCTANGSAGAPCDSSEPGCGLCLRL
jgi:hypothetical protein